MEFVDKLMQSTLIPIIHEYSQNFATILICAVRQALVDGIEKEKSNYGRNSTEKYTKSEMCKALDLSTLHESTATSTRNKNTVLSDLPHTDSSIKTDPSTKTAKQCRRADVPYKNLEVPYAQNVTNEKHPPYPENSADSNLDKSTVQSSPSHKVLKLQVYRAGHDLSGREGCIHSISDKSSRKIQFHQKKGVKSSAMMNCWVSKNMTKAKANFSNLNNQRSDIRILSKGNRRNVHNDQKHSKNSPAINNASEDLTFGCSQCKEYCSHIKQQNLLNISLPQNIKHHYFKPPKNTPEGYWDIEFPDLPG